MKLKILFAAILFLSSLTYATDTNITSKVFEKRDEKGKVILRIETIYRGKTKVLMTMSHTNKQGVLKADSRSYFAGKVWMVEADEDKDGVFESILVSNPKTEEIEMFTRHSNGSVTPVDTRVVEISKKQMAEVGKFFDKGFNSKMDDDKFMERFKESKRNIDALEKEKKSGKAE